MAHLSRASAWDSRRKGGRLGARRRSPDLLQRHTRQAHHGDNSHSDGCRDDPERSLHRCSVGLSILASGLGKGYECQQKRGLTTPARRRRGSRTRGRGGLEDGGHQGREGIGRHRAAGRTS